MQMDASALYSIHECMIMHEEILTSSLVAAVGI